MELYSHATDRRDLRYMIEIQEAGLVEKAEDLD